MKIVAMDIETDGLDATKIWVICAKEVNNKETRTFLNVHDNPTDFVDYCKTVDKFVFHNGLGFDVPVINRLLGYTIDPKKVIDTLIVSRMVDYEIKDGHSLDAWGKRVGLYKGKHTDWSCLSDDMVSYCMNDVEVTIKVYNKFKPVIFDKEWAVALRCEHDIQILCEEMHENGFKFDKPKAEQYLEEILERMAKLNAGFQKDFPPQLDEVNRVKYRVKADGGLHATVIKAIDKYEKTVVDGDDLVCYDYVSFDPGSPKQRIDRLWDAGWKPIEKTKGHLLYEREQRDRARQSWRKIR